MKFMITFLTLTTLTPGYAFYESNELPLTKRFSVSTVTEKAFSKKAQQLVGHLSMAQQAIDFELRDEARLSLEQALNICGSFLREARVHPELAGVPFSKISTRAGGHERAYLTPIWSIESVVDEASMQTFRPERFEITDTHVLATTVKLNLSQAVASLRKAHTAVVNNNLALAREVLSKVFEDVIITEAVAEEPVLNVWSNLVVARQLMDQKNYKSVRFILEKAREHLKIIEDKKLLQSASESEALHKVLTDLSMALEKEDPGVSQKVKETLGQWSRKVRDWR